MSEPAQCDNCGRTWKDEELAEPQRLSERLDPGGVVPAGECPICGALAYPANEVSFLTKLLDDLNDIGCTFFACPGPNVKPVDMATCSPHWAAWAVRERLLALGAPVPAEQEDPAELERKADDRNLVIADADDLLDPDDQSVEDMANSSKFDGLTAEQREVCAALHIIQMNGGADEEGGATDAGGFYARIGVFLLEEDDQGSCTYIHFNSEANAIDGFGKRDRGEV